MTRIIALMALIALGSSGDPFHEPFHDPAIAGATQRNHAPRGLRHPERLTTAARPDSLRVEQVRLPRHGLSGLRPGLPQVAEWRMLQRRALAHTHALFGMFNRSSMATVIADSTNTRSGWRRIVSVRASAGPNRGGST
jgi:hypothetical protein